MEKNQEKIGEVLALGMNGEGILKDEDFTIFVPFALPKEKIKYKVLKVAKKLVYGKLVEIISPSKDRVNPVCPIFSKCGGCQLQHINYQTQLELKQNNIKTCFKKIAKLEVPVDEAVVGDNQFYYRNKLQLPVAHTLNGAIIGFYAENSHRVIEINQCAINGKWANGVIKAFKQYFIECDIYGYDELKHVGDVREVTVKEINGNLIITVVTLNDNLKNKKRLIEILSENVNGEFSLFQNVNSKKTNVIYGDKFNLLKGEKEYFSEMLGVKYKIGVQSFMQVNPIVCKKLYSAVKENLNLTENTTVIDAYSGAGLMTALLAKSAKKAIGIEIIKEAVDIANELAADNGLKDKIINYCGKCEDLLPAVIKREKEENHQVVVVLDPPRKGVDVKVIKAILDSEIDRIIYVSCLPSSLARDVGLIVGSLKIQNGEIVDNPNFTPKYDIEFIKPFDMFPQTKHVETLVCLTKKE